MLGNDADPRWRQLIRQEAEEAQNEATPTNVPQSVSQKNYSWDGMATSVALHRLSFLTAYANSFPGEINPDLLNRLISHYANSLLDSTTPKPRLLVQLSDIITAFGYTPTQTITKLHGRISSLLPFQSMPSIRLALESCLLKIDKEVNDIELNILKYPKRSEFRINGLTLF